MLSRQRSIAFLRSGWIPAIKTLEPLAEKIGGRVPREGYTIDVKGKVGRAVIAVKSVWKTSAQIINNAMAKHTSNEPLATKLAVDGLQKAFNFEERSMKEYIERKQLEAAKKAGIKTN